MDLTKIDKPLGELDRETKIALLTAWVDGAQIEYKLYGSEWKKLCNPAWCLTARYRVVPSKPSIDWSHVSPQFKWMTTDNDGGSWLHGDKPVYWSTRWASNGKYVPANTFASFIPGTCDWKDSLVQRPEGV